MSRLHNATPARTWNNLYCFIVCLTLIFPKAEGTVQTNEGRLHDVLLRGYNKYTHPSTNVTEPVRVVFDFQLIRIVGVSAKDQYIKTYAWVNQYWNNSQLVWDPDDYGGIKEIHLRPQDVWVPDILLYNNVDEEDRFGGGLFTYKTNVALRYDGYNKWLNPAIFKSICSVDVTYFPFDDQTCEMKFGSWSFDISKINLFARRVKKNFNYVKNGEFKLLDLDVKRNVVKYQCCAHAFVDVTVVINIRRESLDYILKLIIPCSLISSMIFLGFILPPESGERIGLSITVMLAMTVFQQLSSELMPSYGFPLLGQYYFATIIEIGSSLFVTTLILNFYHRNSRRMPRTLRKFIIRWLARIVFPFQKPKDWNPSVGGCSLRRHHNNGQDDDSIEEESQMCDEFEPSNAENDPWVPFPLKRNEPMDTHVTPNGVSISKPARNDGSYQLTDLGYETGHARPTDRCGMMSVNGARYSRKGCARNGKSGKAYRRNKENFRRARTHKTSASNSSHLMPFFQGNSASIEMSEEKLKNQKEWIKAARVLDRLFLIVSVTIGVLTLLGIFLKAPRFRLT